MSTPSKRRERMSVDVNPEEHRRIKACAALKGMTIRKYVLESIRERVQRETESKTLSVLTTFLDGDPVLQELWDNTKDAAYDKV